MMLDDAGHILHQSMKDHAMLHGQFTVVAALVVRMARMARLQGWLRTLEVLCYGDRRFRIHAVEVPCSFSSCTDAMCNHAVVADVINSCPVQQAG